MSDYSLIIFKKIKVSSGQGVKNENQGKAGINL
jgi:hypothetical protein